MSKTRRTVLAALAMLVVMGSIVIAGELTKTTPVTKPVPHKYGLTVLPSPPLGSAVCPASEAYPGAPGSATPVTVMQGPQTFAIAEAMFPNAHNVDVTSSNAGSTNFSATNTTFYFDPTSKYGSGSTTGEYYLNGLTPGLSSAFVGGYNPTAQVESTLYGQGNSYALEGPYAEANWATSEAQAVDVEYLTITDYTGGGHSGGGLVNENAAPWWNVEYDNIWNNAYNVADDDGAGVMVGSNNLVAYNCLTQNNEYGWSAYNGAVTHGVSAPNNFTVDRNEISYNGLGYFPDNSQSACTTGTAAVCGNPNTNGASGGAKIWESSNSTIDYNWWHDNWNVGLWADTLNSGINIEGNEFDRQWAEAITIEISSNAKINGNTFMDNAWGQGSYGDLTGANISPAVYINGSGGQNPIYPNNGAVVNSNSEFFITNNTFLDNWGGVYIFEGGGRYCGTNGDDDCSITLPGDGGNANTVASLETCASSSIDTNTAPNYYFTVCQHESNNIEVARNTFTFNALDINPCASGAGQNLATPNNYSCTTPPVQPNGTAFPTGTMQNPTAAMMAAETAGSLGSVTLSASGSSATRTAGWGAIYEGDFVTDSAGDIPANTYVTSISGTTIGLSNAPTASPTGDTLYFTDGPDNISASQCYSKSTNYQLYSNGGTTKYNTYFCGFSALAAQYQCCYAQNQQLTGSSSVTGSWTMTQGSDTTAAIPVTDTAAQVASAITAAGISLNQGFGFYSGVSGGKLNTNTPLVIQGLPGSPTFNFSGITAGTVTPTNGNTTPGTIPYLGFTIADELMSPAATSGTAAEPNPPTVPSSPTNPAAGVDITPADDYFCQNTYSGNWGFDAYAQGTTTSGAVDWGGNQTFLTTLAQWKSIWGQDGTKCPVSVPQAPLGSNVYTPPASFPSTTPAGTVNLPIDPNGCNDGVDSTVGLQNWLNSLPQGTTSIPTIVQFPKTACYVVNGTEFLWGFQNFQFQFGEFMQQTINNLTETTTGFGTGTSGCTVLATNLGRCLGTYYLGANVGSVTLSDAATNACGGNPGPGMCGTVASGGFLNVVPGVGMLVSDTLNDLCTGVNEPVSGCTGPTKVRAVSGDTVVFNQPIIATTTGDTLQFGAYNNECVVGPTVTDDNGTNFPSNAIGMGVTGTGIPGNTVVTAISGDTLTLSNSATTECTGMTNNNIAIGMGQYTNQLGSVQGSPSAQPAAIPSGDTGTGQAMCNSSGTGYGNSKWVDPGGTEPSAAVSASYANYLYDFMFFVEGGCNDVFSNMYMIGANADGGPGGDAEQDNMITFAGTQHSLAYDVSMDGPFGDCLDADGLFEAAAANGNYPASNITADDNICANAGRDDMSVGQSNKINYENNLLYWPAVDIFDVEYDNVCQAGSAGVDQSDINLAGNTIEDNGWQGKGDGYDLSAQTDNPLQIITYDDNTMEDSAPHIYNAGAMSVIVNDLDVTYPTLTRPNGSALTTTGNLIAGNLTISVASTANLAVGMVVTDATVPTSMTPSSELPYSIASIGSGSITLLSTGAGGAGAPTLSETGDTLDFSNPNTCAGTPLIPGGDPGYQGGNVIVAGNTWTDPNTISGGSPTVTVTGVGPLYDYGNVGPDWNGAAYVKADGTTADDTCTYQNNCPGQADGAAAMTAAVQGNAITSCPNYATPGDCANSNIIITGAGSGGSTNTNCSNYTNTNYNTLVTTSGGPSNTVCNTINGPPSPYPPCSHCDWNDLGGLGQPTYPTIAALPVGYTLQPSSYVIGGGLPCTPGEGPLPGETCNT